MCIVHSFATIHRTYCNKLVKQNKSNSSRESLYNAEGGGQAKYVHGAAMSHSAYLWSSKISYSIIDITRYGPFFA